MKKIFFGVFLVLGLYSSCSWSVSELVFAVSSGTQVNDYYHGAPEVTLTPNTWTVSAWVYCRDKNTGNVYPVSQPCVGQSDNTIYFVFPDGQKSLFKSSKLAVSDPEYINELKQQILTYTSQPCDAPLVASDNVTTNTISVTFMWDGISKCDKTKPLTLVMTQKLYMDGPIIMNVDKNDAELPTVVANTDDGQFVADDDDCAVAPVLNFGGWAGDTLVLNATRVGDGHQYIIGYYNNNRKINHNIGDQAERFDYNDYKDGLPLTFCWSPDYYKRVGEYSATFTIFASRD